MTLLHDIYKPFLQKIVDELSNNSILLCHNELSEGSIYLYCIEEVDIVLKFKLQLFSFDHANFVEMKYIEGNTNLYNDINTLFQKY
jgi:hypothetical protein